MKIAKWLIYMALVFLITLPVAGCSGGGGSGSGSGSSTSSLNGSGK